METSEDHQDHDVDKELLKPLYQGSELTILDSHLLLYQYCIRHNLTKKAFSELLVLMEAHLPSNSMVSSYKLKKFVTSLFSDVLAETHFCCSCCQQPLKSTTSRCSNGCNADIFDFVIIPLASQIQRRLESKYY